MGKQQKPARTQPIETEEEIEDKEETMPLPITRSGKVLRRILGKTLTQTKGLKPQRKKTSTDTYQSRILVISPYGQINAYLESRIPEIIRGGYVDVLNWAEKDNPPYLDINEREKNLQKPLWIIDFQKIMADKPSPKYLNEEKIRAFAGIVNEYANHIYRGGDFFSKHLVLANVLKDEDFSAMSGGVGFDLEKILSDKWPEELKRINEKVLREHPITDVVYFSLYRNWKSGKRILYFSPKEDFSKELEKKHAYDENGNFLPNAISVNAYIKPLIKDLQAISGASYETLTLFDFDFNF